jgi:CO dehydrogenase/acetyl-CoA synthase delta subunit
LKIASVSNNPVKDARNLKSAWAKSPELCEGERKYYFSANMGLDRTKTADRISQD